MCARLELGSGGAGSMMIGPQKRPLEQSVDQPAKYLKPTTTTTTASSGDGGKPQGDGGAVEAAGKQAARAGGNDPGLSNGKGPSWRSVLGTGHHDEAGGSAGGLAGTCHTTPVREQQLVHGHGGGGPDAAACTIGGSSSSSTGQGQHHHPEEGGKIAGCGESGQSGGGAQDGAAVAVNFHPSLTHAGGSRDFHTPSSVAGHPDVVVAADGVAEGGQRLLLSLEDGTAQDDGAPAAAPPFAGANPRNVRNSRGNVEVPVGFLETVEKVLEARKTKRTRPLPVMMAGKVLNLYTLDSKVRELGGYCKVTSDAQWGNVARELGFAHLCGPGVKLVYFKYLRKLESRKSVGAAAAAAAAARLNGEQATTTTTALAVGGSQGDSKRRVGVVEQFGDSESSRDDGDDAGRAAHGDVGLCVQNEHCLESRDDKDAWLPDVHDGNGRRAAASRPRRADDLGLGSADFTKEDAAAGEGSAALDHSRSTTESLAQMLNWIKHLAVDPRESSRGGHAHNDEFVQVCHAHAEKVRAFLWRKKDELRSKTPAASAAADSCHGQNKQPSRAHYYEEPAQAADPQALDRLRSTRERSLHYGFPPSPGVHRPAPGGAAQRGSGFLAQGHGGSRQPSSPLPVSYTETVHTNYNFIIGDRGARKKIPIGPDYQATVPPWEPPGAAVAAAERPHHQSGLHGTPPVSEDLRNGEATTDVHLWMGRQVWPPADYCTSAVNIDKLGRGRPAMCLCEDVESVECVRLHIDEERQRLRDEIGDAFTAWKFDEMGEVLADQWTKEEQHVYKTLVKLNPVSLEKNFWDQLPLAFPSKGMKELVSYYFNVFILRRRAMQNRLHGEKIDSDDDETELPITDTESSEDYDTGDEGEDDDDGDADDDGGEETEIPQHLEDRVATARQFTELEPSFNYSSSRLEGECSEGEPDIAMMELPASPGLRLDDDPAHHRHHLHDPATTLGAGWESDAQGDEKNHHMEEEESGLGEDALREVQRWEDPHWDETDHDFLNEHPKPDSSVVSNNGAAELPPKDAGGEQTGAVPVVFGNSS